MRRKLAVVSRPSPATRAGFAVFAFCNHGPVGPHYGAGPMKWIVAVIGFCAIAFAGWWGWQGWSIVLNERGWTAVIASAVIGSAGMLMLGMAALMHRIDALRRVVINQGLAVPSPRPATAEDQPRAVLADETTGNEAPVVASDSGSAGSQQPAAAKLPSASAPAALPESLSQSPAKRSGADAATGFAAGASVEGKASTGTGEAAVAAGVAGLSAVAAALATADAPDQGADTKAAVKSEPKQAKDTTRPEAGSRPIADTVSPEAQDVRELPAAATNPVTSDLARKLSPAVPPRKPIATDYDWPQPPPASSGMTTMPAIAAADDVAAVGPDETAATETAASAGDAADSKGAPGIDAVSVDSSDTGAEAPAAPRARLPRIGAVPAIDQAVGALVEGATEPDGEPASAAMEVEAEPPALPPVPARAARDDDRASKTPDAREPLSDKDKDEVWLDELLNEARKNPASVAGARNEEHVGQDRDPDAVSTDVLQGPRPETDRAASPSSSQPAAESLTEDTDSAGVQLDEAPPAEMPAAGGPPAPAPDERQLLRSYESQGIRYRLYVDGTIDAEGPNGVMSFASLDQLRAYIERRRI